MDKPGTVNIHAGKVMNDWRKGKTFVIKPKMDQKLLNEIADEIATAITTSSYLSKSEIATVAKTVLKIRMSDYNNAHEVATSEHYMKLYEQWKFKASWWRWIVKQRVSKDAMNDYEKNLRHQMLDNGIVEINRFQPIK